MLITPTIRDLMKNSAIYGHCVPCWRSRALDRPCGPEIKVVCGVRGSREMTVFVSYSGLPHGEASGRNSLLVTSLAAACKPSEHY